MIKKVRRRHGPQGGAQKRRCEYRLSITYPAESSPEYDNSFIERIGAPSFTGYSGFGGRELVWRFSLLAHAIDAWQKIHRLSNIWTLRIDRCQRVYPRADT